MSSITLSAATRQNLLSLQDTAALTATTQNRLATGKKVNSALDDPLSFFTAQSLDNRSNDLNNLLNGVSNGVQVIQAANQGITSIQKLIDSAKSLANQALASKNYANPPVSASTTSTTASGAYSAPTGAGGQVVTFTVDGATKTATIPQGSGTSGATVEPADGDAAVAALNASAGSNVFSIDATTHKITIASTSSDITLDSTNAGYLGYTGAVSGTAAVAGSGDATRTSLASQFNSLLTQIDQLASDASYNGVNLLGGGGSNQLKIQFNENGKSNLVVQGVDFSSTGLGLSPVATSGANSNFQADSDVNAVLTKLDAASSTLRAQSTSFGSNLTVVQNRQDFTKQLINILGTGSANLTNADLNEEAANSQALSTRQSMGISALSLANSAQQGVLQLLR
ncbi:MULTISPECIES: flagellin N-terminal helical domain-containing protein [unclassified Methylobacterium]|uniref:flagellin N-terminal helical domain-containing protein n=1 Tax=unclassified Methylobacterium TaxID=2615210 RepID=UPI00135532F0|nr:flagellin [Methylobacterium sp. 2A]MWV22960.1 flagellar protein [Methylobacterium sp. 2A]